MVWQGMTVEERKAVAGSEISMLGADLVFRPVNSPCLLKSHPYQACSLLALLQ